MGVWPIASESERGNGAEGFGYVCDRVMLLIVDLRLRVGGSVFFSFGFFPECYVRLKGLV